MDHLGAPEFEFPNLCKVFGLAAVRKAANVRPYDVRFLESVIQLHMQHFDSFPKTDELFL